MTRGAIAFAMCLQIDSADNKFINSLAITVVMVTTLVSTTTFKKFLKYLKFRELRGLDYEYLSQYLELKRKLSLKGSKAKPSNRLNPRGKGKYPQKVKANLTKGNLVLILSHREKDSPDFWSTSLSFWNRSWSKVKIKRKWHMTLMKVKKYKKFDI